MGYIVKLDGFLVAQRSTKFLPEDKDINPKALSLMTFSDDVRAILILTGHLGAKKKSKELGLLNPKQWNRLRLYLEQIGKSPGDLFSAGLTSRLGHSGFSKLIFGFFGQNPLILAENRRISAKIYTF